MTNDHTVLTSKFSYLKLNSFTGSFASDHSIGKPFCSTHCYSQEHTWDIKLQETNICFYYTKMNTVKQICSTQQKHFHIQHIAAIFIQKKHIFLIFIIYETEQAVIWWPNERQNKQIHTAVRSATTLTLTPTVTSKCSCAGFEEQTQGGSQTCCAHNRNYDSQTACSHRKTVDISSFSVHQVGFSLSKTVCRN